MAGLRAVPSALVVLLVASRPIGVRAWRAGRLSEPALAILIPARPRGGPS